MFFKTIEQSEYRNFMIHYRFVLPICVVLALSGCSTVIPLTYQTNQDVSCKISINDTRLTQNVLEIRVDYPTTFTANTSYKSLKTAPGVNEVIRTELCKSANIKKSGVTFDLNRLSCDVDAGFTETAARAEIEMFYRTADDKLQRTYLSTKVVIQKDTGPYPVCDAAIKKLMSDLNQDIVRNL
uniref:hypothetical protein n=1 Tax=Pseudomonas sp. TaxID=306 RepID=UPI00159EBA77|nr:hypothetical protein [Pseudomonas sp.]